MIALLVGYIFHATVNRIAKVEDEYLNMIELKIRAEAADIAKSQVRIYLTSLNIMSLIYSYVSRLLSCSSWLRFPMRSELR